MAVRRTSHAVYDTSYHLVWCPKYRKRLFAEGYLRERARELFQGISEEYGFAIEALEVSEDHVHILLSFPPKYSIGRVVGTLKSISARTLFQEFPSLKKKLYGDEFWEDGYFARTVGDRMTKEVIEKYIRHHRTEKQAPTQLDLELG